MTSDYDNDRINRDKIVKINKLEINEKFQKL